jgi:type IV pilus assembly protein PilV
MITHAITSGRSGQRGFSLIEVLVTMVVVAVGLMGLISLMLRGVQANASSGLRSAAIRQAYDMTDRMRANIKDVQAGDYNAIVPPGSTSGCPITTTVVSPPSASGLSSCSGNACEWARANAKNLPSGAGAVCKANADNWYTIYVSWDDSKQGSPDKTFILRFEP